MRPSISACPSSTTRKAVGTSWDKREIKIMDSMEEIITSAKRIGKNEEDLRIMGELRKIEIPSEIHLKILEILNQ